MLITGTEKDITSAYGHTRCGSCKVYNQGTMVCGVWKKKVKGNLVCDNWRAKPTMVIEERLAAPLPKHPGDDECCKCFRRSEVTGMCSLKERVVEADSFCSEWRKR